MSKYKLTYAGNKILEFHEVEDEMPRDFYEETATVSKLLDFVRENKLSIDGDHKIALRYSENLGIKELFLVLKDNELPKQYFFETEEKALAFSKQQGLEQSVHLQPQTTKEVVKAFFNGEDCKFPGFNKIKENYAEEIVRSGGESCTKCAKNRIMKKYQELIIDALSDDPQNNFSQLELSKKQKKTKTNKTK